MIYDDDDRYNEEIWGKNPVQDSDHPHHHHQTKAE